MPDVLWIRTDIVRVLFDLTIVRQQRAESNVRHEFVGGTPSTGSGRNWQRTTVLLIPSYNSLNLDHRFQRLIFAWRRMDFSNDVHAFGYLSKRRESLPVRRQLATKIELGLIADADKEMIGRRIRACLAPHGNGAVHMLQSRF